MDVERESPLRREAILEFARSLAAHGDNVSAHHDILGLQVSIDVHDGQLSYTAHEFHQDSCVYLVDYGQESFVRS